MFRSIKVLAKTRMGLFLIIGLFALAQIFLVWNGGYNKVFNSPDANINYTFSLQVARQKSLSLPTIDSQVKEFVTPRSARVIGDKIVPVGFIGLIVLYGFLGGILGIYIIPYLTILFAVMGMIYFYNLLKEVFNRQVAWWSVLLLALHPAWIYYTNRSLMPNVLFVSFLIPAMYYLYQVSQRTRKLDFFLCGIFTSAAILVRTSEFSWIIVVIVAYIIIQRHHIFLKKLVWTILGAAPFIIVALINLLTTYQGRASLGYNIQQLSVETSWMNNLAVILFPFGVHPRLMLLIFNNYLVSLFLPFTVLTLAGLLHVWKNFNLDKHKYYIYIWFFILIYLTIMYGSWLIVDSSDPNSVTIGTSYVRYFLPIYVLSLPFGAWLLQSLAANFRPRWRNAFLIFMTLTLAIFSIKLSIFDPLEGIQEQRRNLHIYQRTVDRVSAFVDREDVILTFKADKYLWPKFNVIVPSGDENYLNAVKVLLTEKRQLFFLHLNLDKDEEALFNDQWAPYGFTLGEKMFAAEDLALYKIHELN